jgi:hypothetical protein
MRIERKGTVAKLTPRLERFFIKALGGESLDDILHAEARKADFRCLRGLLAIELKTLEQDGARRIDNLTARSKSTSGLARPLCANIAETLSYL